MTIVQRMREQLRAAMKARDAAKMTFLRYWIAGLTLGSIFGWRWLDPVVGIVGALVIANWSYGLIRDTGAILLDMIPDRRLAADLRRAIENEGDRLADLHLWRLGPGHLGVIAAVVTSHRRGPDYYRKVLARFPSLSHVTVEVHAAGTGSI